MTIQPAHRDQHSAVCAAMTRSTPVLCSVLEQSPGGLRPARMRWTNAEVAAHMLASVVEAEKAARGQASAYDLEPSAEADERMVASVQDRDPVVLAHLLGERTASYLDTVRRLDGAQPLATPRSSVAVLTALLTLDQHLHGGQLAETSGQHWTRETSDLHAPLLTVVPYAFDAVAARGVRGSFVVRLRGVAPVAYAVDDGRLDMDVRGSADCVITTDVPTFLRTGIGAASQLRSVLTGRLRVGGRKPWLAAKVDRLFPPIPHGGVAR